jgi:pimeloyl-ACP methyl ester carboxylesterase
LIREVDDQMPAYLTSHWPRVSLNQEGREWLERELKRSKFPTILVWGREDEVFDHKTFATRFKELLPHAEGPELVTGRHFLQEDSGAELPFSQPMLLVIAV